VPLLRETCFAIISFQTFSGFYQTKVLLTYDRIFITFSIKLISYRPPSPASAFIRLVENFPINQSSIARKTDAACSDTAERKRYFSRFIAGVKHFSSLYFPL
jgi:hypothetical protein